MGFYALYVLLLNPSNYTLFLHWNTFQFNGFGSHLMLFTMKLRYFRSSYKFGHDITSLLLYIEELSFVIHFKNKFLLFVNVLLDDPFHCIFLSSICFGFVDSGECFLVEFYVRLSGLIVNKTYTRFMIEETQLPYVDSVVFEFKWNVLFVFGRAL